MNTAQSRLTALLPALTCAYPRLCEAKKAAWELGGRHWETLGDNEGNYKTENRVLGTQGRASRRNLETDASVVCFHF